MSLADAQNQHYQKAKVINLPTCSILVNLLSERLIDRSSYSTLRPNHTKLSASRLHYSSLSGKSQVGEDVHETITIG